MNRLLLSMVLAPLVGGSLRVPGANSIAGADIWNAVPCAIVGVTVIDVDAGVARPGQTVVVCGDRVATVGPADDVSVPGDAVIVDGRDLFLMPGLCDAHVHYFDRDTFGRLLIANGVTFVRDMGLANELILPLRDELQSGVLLGPELRTAGAILDGTPPIIPPISVGVGTPEEGRAAVRTQVAAGVDMIKVYSRLGRDAFLAILDEAHSLGLKATGHVPDSIPIEEAAAAGLGSCEHFFGFEKLIGRLLGAPVTSHYEGMGAEAGYLLRYEEVRPEALRQALGKLRDSGLVICPTVNVFRAGVRTSQFQSGVFPLSEYVSASVLETWRALWGGQGDLPEVLWQTWARFVTVLHAAGIPLMVGTDLSTPGSVPGFSVHDEMEIWQEAGIPAPDILRSATLVPARFLGLDGRLGTIAEGKTASMVLLRANPLENIRNAREIEAVFLRGRYYDRRALDHLLEEARDLAER